MMSLTRHTLVLLAFAAIAIVPVIAQKPLPDHASPQEHRTPDGRYTYYTMPGDPMGARLYRLKNGLTVMLSVNRVEPRIQTMIATRAGSKNDPADHTGLAHYLEHMLFKGTDRFGTLSWGHESGYISEIEGLYERYNQTRDESQRRGIYHLIDSVSGVAARYAIPNEYDKLVGAIGARGTNAFTSVEQTTYVNDIPSSQLEKWLAIEAERFRAPVFRLFHTELEAVYEEKNISLDNDNAKVFDALHAALFHNHSYGTQTTIGTIEHLKNPSLKAIRKFYEAYYVPNNMGIILSGDLDPDQAIAMIDRYFGSMIPSASVPQYAFTPEPLRAKPQEVTVYGTDAEQVRIAFRAPGAGTREALILELADLIFSYKGAGLIDINLNQKQKVVFAASQPNVMKDYSYELFTGVPREGQSLEEVKDLILEQVERVKRGEFDEATLRAAIRNLQVDQIEQYENNGGRAYAMLDAFVLGIPWGEYSRKIEMMAGVSKQEIVAFARKYFGNDYVVVYKRKGEDRNVVKIEKPPITPVPLNRDTASDFVTKLLSAPSPSVTPIFVDYNKDFKRGALKNGNELLYLENTENQLFTLYYVFEMGKKNDLYLPIAIEYLKFLGTDKASAEQLARSFFGLGAQFNVSVANDRVYVSLTGLRESFVPALKLFEDLLARAKPDEKALRDLVGKQMKLRSDAKLDKSSILWGGLFSYARYGRNSPFTLILSDDQLQGLKAKELASRIHSLLDYRHTVLYYGPGSMSDVTTQLNQHHRQVKALDYPPAKTFAQPESEKVVYFVNYDGMVQAEVLWLNRQGRFDPGVVPVASLFNQYYGGDMSSVVFQEIRESKALAYGTFAAYDIPDRSDDPFYVLAYIGTQADKLNDAIPAMNNILRNMPMSEGSFIQAREALRNKLQTDRVIRTSILFNYLDARKLGLDHDIRRETYGRLDEITLDDLKRFHDARFASDNYTLAVLGDRTKIDLAALARYGRVIELSLQDIFGY